MKFTKEQKLKAYKNLSLDVQNFITYSETTELIETNLSDAGLNEDQAESADSEILYAMYGLQTLHEAIENIAKITNKKAGDLTKLESELQKNIFDKIASEQSSPAVINKNKVLEISKKYSLDDGQTEKLIGYIQTSTEQKKSPEVTEIINSLNISRLLADQLVEELKNRVLTENKKVTENRPATSARVPEIKPDNLPAIEIGEVAKPYTPEYKSPVSAPKLAEEPVQRPYSVPRFGMAQVEPKVQVINMTQNKPQNPATMMASKMENVTVNMGSDFVQKGSTEATEPPKMPTTKYGSDPYREPIN